MSFGPSTDADFTIGGTSLKNYLNSLDAGFTRALSEIKTFGVIYVQQLYGHIMCSISADAEFDPALDLILWNALTGSGAVAWAFYPQGNSSGKVKYSGNCRVSGYNVNAGGEDVKQPFQASSDGVISRELVSP